MHEIVFFGRLEAWGMRSGIDVGRAYAEEAYSINELAEKIYPPTVPFPQYAGY